MGELLSIKDVSKSHLATAHKNKSNKSILSFVDNRFNSAIQKQVCILKDNPIQKMKAYDKTNQFLDPRHFSTPDLKQAIDDCVLNKTIIPGWLKNEVLGYLQDELLERDQDMQSYGGGDEGHKNYFTLVQEYVKKVNSLHTTEDQPLPTDKTAIQL